VIVLLDNQTGAELGVLTPEQLAFLSSHLEEESAEDQDYYINQATLDLFASKGGDPALIDLLRRALGSREDIEVRWETR
jgi:processive 1,2-diacylglycerol beta-glucosyltransferase